MSYPYLSSWLRQNSRNVLNVAQIGDRITAALELNVVFEKIDDNTWRLLPPITTYKTDKELMDCSVFPTGKFAKRLLKP